MDATSIPRRRIGLAFAAVLIAGLAGTGETRASASQSAPWCAYLGGHDGTFDCSYYTFEQCMATAWGLGNYCRRNIRTLDFPDDPPPRRLRRRR